MVVHCAAERRPDVVEKKTDLAERLNISATEKICQHAGNVMLCTFIVSLLANKMRLRSPNMLSLILFCQPLQPYDINDLSF